MVFFCFVIVSEKCSYATSTWLEKFVFCFLFYVLHTLHSFHLSHWVFEVYYHFSLEFSLNLFLCLYLFLCSLTVDVWFFFLRIFDLLIFVSFSRLCFFTTKQIFFCEKGRGHFAMAPFNGHYFFTWGDIRTSRSMKDLLY